MDSFLNFAAIFKLLVTKMEDRLCFDRIKSSVDGDSRKGVLIDSGTPLADDERDVRSKRFSILGKVTCSNANANVAAK